jgi:hypothetical protein
LFGFEVWRLWPATIERYRADILSGEVIRWVISPIGIAERRGFPVWPVALSAGAVALALPFLRYCDPIEALFGLTLAAILIMPYGCPDNMVGLMPLAARNISHGKLVEIIPVALLFPRLTILSCFVPLLRLQMSAELDRPARPVVGG